MDDKLKEFEAILTAAIESADQRSDYDPTNWDAAVAAQELRSIRASFHRIFTNE